MLTPQALLVYSGPSVFQVPTFVGSTSHRLKILGKKFLFFFFFEVTIKKNLFFTQLADFIIDIYAFQGVLTFYVQFILFFLFFYFFEIKRCLFRAATQETQIQQTIVLCFVFF